MVFFEKCCFCVPLRPGCLIVAYLNLIGSILATIFAIYALIIGANLYESHKPREEQLGLIFICISVVLILFLVISFSFCVVLLVGLHKNKPGHVKAYLIYSLVFIIIYAIAILVKLISGAGDAIGGVVNLLVSIYSILVIKSYHKKMLEDNPVNVQKV